MRSPFCFGVLCRPIIRNRSCVESCVVIPCKFVKQNRHFGHSDIQVLAAVGVVVVVVVVVEVIAGGVTD